MEYLGQIVKFTGQFKSLESLGQTEMSLVPALKSTLVSALVPVPWSTLVSAPFPLLRSTMVSVPVPAPRSTAGSALMSMPVPDPAEHKSAAVNLTSYAAEVSTPAMVPGLPSLHAAPELSLSTSAAVSHGLSLKEYRIPPKFPS